jgi:hypothetical protein
VVTVHLPPFRDRLEHITVQTGRFLDRHGPASPSPMRRWMPSSPTTGPAMCANCRTASSAW